MCKKVYFIFHFGISTSFQIFKMWNQRSAYIIVVAFAVLIAASNVRAEDEEDDDDAPRSCYKYTGDFLKSSTLTILKCLGEKFKPKSLGEYATRVWCILKCVLQELGSISPDGKFDDIGAAFFFEENFDTPVKEGLLPNVQSCFALSELFDARDYWCKTYQPFITCVLKSLVAQLLPYSLNCFVGPGLASILDILKNIAPDPVLSADATEVRRRMSRPKSIFCYNKNCTMKYKIEKANGTSTFILYAKNMTELSRALKKPKVEAITMN